MPSDTSGKTPDEIAVQLKRAGIAADPELTGILKKALGEIEVAAVTVRQGIERNDEPASAFHVPFEKK